MVYFLQHQPSIILRLIFYDMMTRNGEFIFSLRDMVRVTLAKTVYQMDDLAKGQEATFPKTF
jgi:hypothetical protein